MEDHNSTAHRWVAASARRRGWLCKSGQDMGQKVRAGGLWVQKIEGSRGLRVQRIKGQTQLRTALHFYGQEQQLFGRINTIIYEGKLSRVELRINEMVHRFVCS